VPIAAGVNWGWDRTPPHALISASGSRDALGVDAVEQIQHADVESGGDLLKRREQDVVGLRALDSRVRGGLNPGRVGDLILTKPLLASDSDDVGSDDVDGAQDRSEPCR
jgi:hypothetical protein